MADVVRVFLQDCPARLVAIEIAVAARYPEALHAAAHALRGAAANLGADRLAAAAGVLERLSKERRMEGIDAPWRLLSLEAGALLDPLSGSATPPDKQPRKFTSWAPPATGRTPDPLEHRTPEYA